MESNIYYYTSRTEFPDGNYTFTIYASDVFGNPMDDFIDKDFVIDTNPPVLSNFTYMVSGTTSYGKMIDIILDFEDSEVMKDNPLLKIENFTLFMYSQSFIDIANNVYKYYYTASLSDAQKQASINATDKAGNEFYESRMLRLTAPTPPITFPSQGSVISPFTSRFNFFFFERVPASKMKILFNNFLISDSFTNTSVEYLKNMLYYYNVQPTQLSGTEHKFTIEAWDDYGNKLGPYDVSFTVDPNAPKNPSVYFDTILLSSDASGCIYTTNPPRPTIKIEFSDDYVEITDFKIINSNLSYVDVDPSEIVTANDKTFYYDVDYSLNEGLTSVMFTACKKSNPNYCLVNFAASAIINSRAPYITWINPRGFDNAKASSVYMVIQTDEWSECKYDDTKVTGVLPKYFFEDDNGYLNNMYLFFENNNGYGGNGYTHDTKIALTGNPDTSLPYNFSYSVVCRDMFGSYTPINYSTFTLDQNPPVIESITPSESLTYYFLLNVTINEPGTCKYIMINSSNDVPNQFDGDDISESYQNFYDNNMIKIDDDNQLDVPRKVHAEIFDHNPSKGRIVNDGYYYFMLIVLMRQEILQRTGSSICIRAI